MRKKVIASVSPFVVLGFKDRCASRQVGGVCPPWANLSATLLTVDWKPRGSQWANRFWLDLWLDLSWFAQHHHHIVAAVVVVNVDRPHPQCGITRMPRQCIVSLSASATLIFLCLASQLAPFAVLPSIQWHRRTKLPGGGRAFIVIYCVMLPGWR